MVENTVRLGLVADIGNDETSAWLKVGELGLIEKYIKNPLSSKLTFGEFCVAYIKDGLPFRKKDGRRKKRMSTTYTTISSLGGKMPSPRR